MLEVLVASRPRRQLGPHQALVSFVLHVAMISASVVATRGAVRTIDRPTVDTTLLFLPRLAPPEAQKPPPPSQMQHTLVLPVNPPPKGFQTIAAVEEMPTTIPPVDPNQRALDPRDFTGQGVEGGVSWGVIGGTGTVDSVSSDLKDLLVAAESRDERFRRAELLVKPDLPYPALLREAGVEGRVVVQFVIDTLGDVEPTSVKVLETSHRLFTEAARLVVHARFRPALLGERPVRQLTRWPLRWTVVERQ